MGIALAACMRLSLLHAAAVAVGCTTSDVPTNQQIQVVKTIPVETNRNLDLLFVIDNSLSMISDQAGSSTSSAR